MNQHMRNMAMFPPGGGHRREQRPWLGGRWVVGVTVSRTPSGPSSDVARRLNMSTTIYAAVHKYKYKYKYMRLSGEVNIFTL